MKFKELNNKAKLEFIWDYYKFPIIITLSILFLVYYLLNLYIINPPNKEGMYIIVLSDEVDIVKTEELTQEFTQWIQLPEKTDLMIDIVPIGSDSDANTRMAAVSKFFARVQMQKIDLLIFDEWYFMDTINNEDVFENLSTIMTTEEIQRLEKRLIKDVRGNIVGIKVGDAPWLKDRKLKTDGEQVLSYANPIWHEALSKQLFHSLLKDLE